MFPTSAVPHNEMKKLAGEEEQGLEDNKPATALSMAFTLAAISACSRCECNSTVSRASIVTL
jgi:hypothetical protein